MLTSVLKVKGRRAYESGGPDQGALHCFLSQKGYDRGSIWKLTHFNSVISAIIASPL
jgi:hypothetical protein